MLRAVLLCLAAAGLLAACAAPVGTGGAGPAFAPERCDDGGDGGVIIDGVCL
jgi:hypothetical protein